MKAYFISNIIGDGTFNEETGEDNSFRPAVAEYPVNWAGIAAFDHGKNQSKNWMLVVVAADEATLATMGNDSRMTRLVFGPADLDTQWNQIGKNPSGRNKFSAFIRSRTGVPIQPNDRRTVREVLTVIGQSIEPNFNPGGLDVAE